VVSSVVFVCVLSPFFSLSLGEQMAWHHRERLGKHIIIKNQAKIICPLIPFSSSIISPTMAGGAKGSFTCLDRCSKLVTVYKRWGLLRDWPRAMNKAPVTLETCKKMKKVTNYGQEPIDIINRKTCLFCLPLQSKRDENYRVQVLPLFFLLKIMIWYFKLIRISLNSSCHLKKKKYYQLGFKHFLIGPFLQCLCSILFFGKFSSNWFFFLYNMQIKWRILTQYGYNDPIDNSFFFLEWNWELSKKLEIKLRLPSKTIEKSLTKQGILVE